MEFYRAYAITSTNVTKGLDTKTKGPDKFTQLWLCVESGLVCYLTFNKKGREIQFCEMSGLPIAGFGNDLRICIFDNLEKKTLEEITKIENPFEVEKEERPNNNKKRTRRKKVENKRRS